MYCNYAGFFFQGQRPSLHDDNNNNNNVLKNSIHILSILVFDNLCIHGVHIITLPIHANM